MASGKASSETWGPVDRGFSVSFPDGERGRVEETRVRDGAMELLIVERSPRPGCRDLTGVEAAGGIVRMSVRHSSRLGELPEEAA